MILFTIFHCPYLYSYTRAIQKLVPFANIASAALRSRWCACVPSLLILWQDTDGICGHSNSVYSSCCVFVMFKKIENPAACEMRPVIRFLNAKYMTPAEIHRQLCDVYGEHAMSSSMVRRSFVIYSCFFLIAHRNLLSG